MKKKTEVKLNKELNHSWTMLCSGSSVDEQSNNISIFNIIETLNLELTPGEQQEKEKNEKGWYSVPFNLQLVTKIQKPNIDLDTAFDLQYQIFDPEGKKIGKEFGASMKFGKGSDNLRIRNQIGTFPITVGGNYKIVVSISPVGVKEFTKVGESNFKVNLTVKKPE